MTVAKCTQSTWPSFVSLSQPRGLRRGEAERLRVALPEEHRRGDRGGAAEVPERLHAPVGASRLALLGVARRSACSYAIARRPERTARLGSRSLLGHINKHGSPNVAVRSHVSHVLMGFILLIRFHMIS